MRYAYMKLPEGWDTYWSHRMVDSMTIREATQLMVDKGYEGWGSMDIFAVRQLEMYTINTIPCECEMCLHGFDSKSVGIDHRVPVQILAPKWYNEERSPNVRYSK